MRAGFRETDSSCGSRLAARIVLRPTRSSAPCLRDLPAKLDAVAPDDAASGEAARRARSSRLTANLTGTTVAHYFVASHLGSGGMGDVYVACDTVLDRDVALKVLPSEDAGTPTACSA